jgi:hypothetical protein
MQDYTGMKVSSQQRLNFEENVLNHVCILGHNVYPTLVLR